MRRAAALLTSLSLVITLIPAAALAAPSSTGSWIVTLREDVDPSSAAPRLAREHGGAVGHVYEHAINGFSFHGSAEAASALARNPHVALVEANAEVWLDTTQSGATWGIDRIDQRNLPLSGTYTYEATGAGVTAYVIDSGIRTSHTEFADNRATASAEADFIDDGQDGQDCNGHGTHVAGTIGGATYGVAKAVDLVSVRVFGCSGGSTWETIIAGIDWVIADHPAGAPAVANMSLGGGANSSVDTATRNLITDGVATAVAAGNGNFIGRQDDACKYSPARVAEAMTISATDKTDAKASWANYGNCVDWFAPGVSITSAWYDGNSASKTISGTSMATPHTAGVAALYLQGKPTALPAEVAGAIAANTTNNIVTSSSTENNDLLYMGFLNAGGGDAPAEENQDPTAGTVNITVEAGQTAIWSPAVEDPDGDPLTCTLGSASPTQGTAALASCEPDAGTYTADPDAGGGDSFTYAVDDGQGGSAEGTVNVTITAAGPPGGITLSVFAYKVKGLQKADLTWNITNSTHVNVYRGGTITTIPNEGAYTDHIDQRGGGTYTYTVCEADSLGVETGICSNEATASF